MQNVRQSANLCFCSNSWYMKLTLSLNVKHVYAYRDLMKVNQISTILYGPSPAK